MEHDNDLGTGETSPKAGVMTKAELVDEVARVVQLTKKQAETIVNIVFDSIVDSLRAGQKIELRGFGSFRLRSRKSRTGRNPKTGEKVEVPSKKIPYFKPGKELKELINHTLGETVADTPAADELRAQGSGLGAQTPGPGRSDTES
ncbi:MAG: integration host factor subunit beta [Thermoanaerobaculia bacterium]